MDVEYDAALTDVEEMKAALNAGGYQVNDIIWPDVPDETHFDITPQKAKEIIDTDSELIVIDVREYDEYCHVAGHIPGAENYPWNSGILKQYYTDIPAGTSILVVCGSGIRSHEAAQFLAEQGYTVYDMTGGMADWIWETELCGSSEPDDPSEPSEPEADSGDGDGGGGCFIRVMGLNLGVLTGR